MKPERWQKVKALFDAVVELSEDKRRKILDQACQNDDDLRREVESLLASDDEADSFMKKPPVAEIDSLIIQPKKLEAGKRFGHYEIIRQIGAGGMGEVYLAEDTKLDRNVALKILNHKFAKHDSNLKRFIQEAKAASALSHPNILVIHEIGEAENVHYIVSEFIEGQTLREILDRSPLKLSEVLEISIQIAAALSAAHAAKIVHRDVKPENIIVRPDGFVKILDFGLAKLLGRTKIGLEGSTVKHNETAQGIILGTVNYMSPEQAKGQKVDQRTDIFSFGIVIYEMLSGRTPFAGDSMSETFANLIKAEPPPLSRLAANVPDELQRIVSKTLCKDKDQRYQTVNELLADLKQIKETITLGERLPRSTGAGQDETVRLIGPQPGKTTERIYKFISVKGRKLKVIALLVLIISTFAYVSYWRKSPASAPEIRSLAVLPLRSLDTGENYLGLGIADAVIRRISQTSKLTVRPTSSVRRYLKEDTDALTAARQLNADAVLEGNVQRVDDRLRVSVNLLRTDDGGSLWADSFDMRMTDIFTIQDKVAQQVASRLRLQFDPAQQARLTKPSTSNPVAYEFYLKGVFSFDQRVSSSKAETEKTISFFEQAVKADPNFALAHAHLAYAYAIQAVFKEPTEPVWVERAKEEIDRAEALDPQLAETHLVRFQLLFSMSEGYQAEAAIRELLTAQQFNPNVGHSELAYLYCHLGLENLAAREIQRAFEIDPTSEFTKMMNLLLYEVGVKYDEYGAERERYHEDFMKTWYLMGKGRLDEAQKAIDEWSAKKPDAVELPYQKALLLALKGDFPAAEAAIPTVLSRHPGKDPFYHHAAYNFARIYALQGKSVEAVKWLQETVATGFQPYPLFERDAYLDRIRQTPEFIGFMALRKEQFERYKKEFE